MNDQWTAHRRDGSGVPALRPENTDHREGTSVAVGSIRGWAWVQLTLFLVGSSQSVRGLHRHFPRH